jgi:hypothetical protein
MLCEVTPGSLAGTCIIPTLPPVVVPDGGAIEPDAGGPEPDAGGPDTGVPPVCAYFGQACSVTTSCCGGMPCVNDSLVDCTAADLSCICFSPE